MTLHPRVRELIDRAWAEGLDPTPRRQAAIRREVRAVADRLAAPVDDVTRRGLVRRLKRAERQLTRDLSDA